MSSFIVPPDHEKIPNWDSFIRNVLSKRRLVEIDVLQFIVGDIERPQTNLKKEDILWDHLLVFKKTERLVEYSKKRLNDLLKQTSTYHEISELLNDIELETISKSKVYIHLRSTYRLNPDQLVKYFELELDEFISENNLHKQTKFNIPISPDEKINLEKALDRQKQLIEWNLNRALLISRGDHNYNLNYFVYLSGKWVFKSTLKHLSMLLHHLNYTPESFEKYRPNFQFLFEDFDRKNLSDAMSKTTKFIPEFDGKINFHLALEDLNKIIERIDAIDNVGV